MRGIAVGHTFTLAGHPRASLCKRYLVTQTVVEASSDHFGSQGGPAAAGGTYAGDGQGENYICRVAAIDATQPFRTPRTTPRPEIRGPQTAVMVGPKGEEIYTDEFGRVKVMFHWDCYCPGDENSSCWIRVAQAWAGRKWGGMNIPRVGQEVIVEFLEADPDQPIVTGRVYNGRSTPPYTLPDQKTMSTMKSNSTKGGDGFNEIRFEDKKGAEQVFIHSQKRMDVRVRDSYYETNYGNRETRVGWEKDGDKGGDHNTLVRKDVNTHIEGGEFRHVDKQLNQTVDGDVVEKHKKNHSIVVTDRSSLNAKELVVETSDLISQKTKKVTVDGSQEISARGGKVNLEATQQINLKAMQVNIEGTTGVSLKVGGSFVSLSPAGVFVNGTMVGLNSGGSAGSAGPASAATSLAKADIELPIQAAVADDGKPGNVGSITGRSRTREKVTLTPQKAPAYVPPPPPPPAPAPRPPAATGPAGSQAAIVKPPQKQAGTGACCQCELSLTCQHGGRKAINGLLQVVPASKTVVRKELKLGPITASTASGFGPDTVTVTAKQTKEKDSTCTCKPQIVVSGAGNERTDKSVLNLLAKPPSSQPFWPFRTQPRVYHVGVEGCKSAPRPCTVECFPPAQVELDIDLSELKEYLEAFRKGLKAIYELLNGEEPEFTYLEGGVKGTWGWQEGDDNLAYFAADVSAGFQPLIAFEDVKLKCSVANYVPAFIRQHIADVYAYLQFDGGIDGNLYWKTNGPVVSGSKGWDCGGRLEVSVTLSLGIEATAGAKEIVGIKIGARIKAPFNGKVEAVFDPENGFGIDPEITWDGLSGEVYAEVKGSGWFGWVKEGVSLETPFIPGGDIWNPPAFYPFK